MTRAKRLLFLYQQQQLPKPDHTELSYLQSNGFQSINTGINGKSTIKIEVKWRVLSLASQGYIFGSTPSNNIGRFCLQRNGANLISQYYNLNTVIASNITLGTDYVLIKDGNLVYLNGSLVFTDSPTTFDNGFPIHLFARNTAGVAGVNETTGICYCKIWDVGSLVGDFIPVIKDGIYCMYDNVTQTYFYNMGPGSFLGG